MIEDKNNLVTSRNFVSLHSIKVSIPPTISDLDANLD